MKNRYPGGKFKTLFEQNTWTVARVKGTLVTIKRKDETVTRNILCFKLYHGERLESEGKEMAESHVRENEVVRRPSSHGEAWLPSCPSPASEEREGMDVALHREPDQDEETAHHNRYPEVTNPEIIPRGGTDRFTTWNVPGCEGVFSPACVGNTQGKLPYEMSDAWFGHDVT
ncbi:hypothetical protein NDU88_004035 [Pleurodeles waltl]|uniref:Uncharacterized protein n=1 Tax=Pleurodeles waltl TaxID=8319 RepID=A0AAV7MAH6_PLEWA|nr:hypothetical protein NDU88_004035 [Pleurodeles waltl]